MRKTHILALGFLVLGLLVFSACAGRPAAALLDTAGWEKLGERAVRFAVDQDAIQVTSSEGRFKRLMVIVRDSALEMFDIKVVFGNGNDWSADTRLVFDQNSRSRVIDLPGGDRVIRRVSFRYKSLGVVSGRATVELWGK